MSHTLVKICGLSEPATLDVALDAGADMVGFVFFPKSPRHISLEAARALAARVDGRARKVALVVDADDSEIAAIVAALSPDLLQLHGRETPARAAAIASRFGLPLIKALGVATRDDLEKADAFAPLVDYLLLDAKPPPGASRPGGLGATFDWAILSGWRPGRPWLLSGGLAPDNVAEALARTNAPGVDVSSGVESAPGVKDAGRIRAFVAAARALSSGAPTV